MAALSPGYSITELNAIRVVLNPANQIVGVQNFDGSVSMFGDVLDGGGEFPSNASGALAALGQAASRRVDVVMLGDSNHFFDAYGMAWGISGALYAKYGCYATGITCPTGTSAIDPAPTDHQTVNGTDNGYASTETGNSVGNSTGFSALDALWWTGSNSGTNLIAPRARWAVTSGSNNLGGIQLNETHQIGIENLMRFWIGHTRAPSGPLSGGSFTPNIRYARGATTVLVANGVKTYSGTGGSAPEVFVDSMDLAAGARTAGCDLVLRAGGGVTVNGSIGYLFSRVENPAKTNGYSFHNLFATAGKCAYDMAASLITYSTIAQLTNYFTEVRRLQISTGQNPIVVIYINSNFNDISAAKSLSPSFGPLAGSTSAGSKEAYCDNLVAIKNRIIAVWTANGWDTNELYWLFVPSHIGPNYGAALPGYKANRDYLKITAPGVGDTKTTVIDLVDYQPPGSSGSTEATWQVAAANLGWYSQQTGTNPGSPIPPPNTNMIHMTEKRGSAPNQASYGYDGIGTIMATLVP